MSKSEKITIICSRPGMRRAGMEHPAKASYAADKFSDEQLELLKGDPNFQVLEGEAKTDTDEASGLLLAEATAQITALEEQLSSKDAEIDALKAEAAKSAKEIKALEAKLKKLEAASKDTKE